MIPAPLYSYSDVIELLRKKNVINLTILPDADSYSYLTDSVGTPIPITFFPDRHIGKSALASGLFDPHLALAVAKLACKMYLKDVSLFDVGANIGFFSRQIKNLIGSNIVNIHAFEPSPDNFNLLKANLGPVPGAVLHNYGLSSHDEMLDLKMDSGNTGNYSFVDSAVKKGQLEDIRQVKVRNSNHVMEELCKNLSGPFIYKSDTQGFDQFIACSIDSWFWEKVSIAVFELWRLPSPKQYDTKLFEQIISGFDNLRFLHKLAEPVAPFEVSEFLAHSDDVHADLIAWKNI